MISVVCRLQFACHRLSAFCFYTIPVPRCHRWETIPLFFVLNIFSSDGSAKLIIFARRPVRWHSAGLNSRRARALSRKVAGLSRVRNQPTSIWCFYTPRHILILISKLMQRIISTSLIYFVCLLLFSFRWMCRNWQIIIQLKDSHSEVSWPGSLISTRVSV